MADDRLERLTVLPEEWSRVRSVLTEALRVPPGERTQFIEDAYPNNPRLWDELLAILDGYDRATHSVPLEWSEDPALNRLLPGGVAESTRVPIADRTTALVSVGQQYGSYRVLRELKPGGMGQVFLAEDVRMPRRVVLKSLAEKWLASPEAHQRFRREANAACVLNHGHIATLYDVVEDRGLFLLVFEYVEGRTLRELLLEGRVPLGLALRLALQLTDAITYAHDQGIVHCDIKPENVQVTPDGRAKVLDFGLARARFDTGEDSAPEGGKLLGTPGYMAPERLVRGALNASGDIYCLGVVLFELLTARHPYPERGPAQLLAVIGADAPAPSKLAADVPEALDRICRRALARDPMMRYQSARELARDLSDARKDIEPPSPRPRPLPSVVRTVVAVIVATAVLTAAGFLTSTAYNSPLGRTGGFEGESPFGWPLWGVRSLIAPLGFMTLVGLAVTLVKVSCQLALRSSTLRRLCAPLLDVWARTSERLRHTPDSTLASVLLMLQVGCVALLAWRYSWIFAGLDNFISQRPPSNLEVFRPENWIRRNQFYRELFVYLFGFTLAWYALYKQVRPRREREASLLLAAGAGITVITLVVGQVIPYRVLFQSRAERVAYEGSLCYLVGQRADEALLFCPLQPPPWKKIVNVRDPALERQGVYESIFAGFDSRQ